MIGLLILGTGITYFAIISLGALSGIMSERSGVLNIGINGMMIIGGVTYAIFSYLTDAQSSDVGAQFLGYALSMLAAGAFALLHAVACIKLKANQIISGTAINMLALGIALVLIKVISGQAQIQVELSDIKFSNDSNSFLGKFGVNFIIAIVLLVGAWFALNKTKWGLRLKAVGENPSAADAAGINVHAKQYQGVMLSGMIAGIAGAFFAQKIYSFSGNVEGLGFLSLAIMIMAQWRTYYAGLAGLAFGMLISFALVVSQNPTWMPSFYKISELTKAFPFILTLISLVFFSKNAKGPKAAGVVYDKTLR